MIKRDTPLLEDTNVKVKSLEENNQGLFAER